MRPTFTRSYTERAGKFSNPAARQLLEVMARKQSNLCISVDVTLKGEFLEVVDAVGPYTCLIKTHIDIIEDFDQDLITQLKNLSSKHDFLIFEDRKFADIGNTVVLQYSKGVHKIASWSDITNAHAIPGPSIITGLASVGVPLGRGLLLLAEMSSKGSLASGSYTEGAVRMARDHRDFVIGFIAQNRMEGIGSRGFEAEVDEDFLIITPGVGLDQSGDSMGQQYRTPFQVVAEGGSDVIIVGRGIYGGGVDIPTIQTRAERYRAEGWKAYEARLK
ncbi:Orotidine 5'-phosphate decarboxylase [Rickenella mellea]|uniref:Orotidine 5'-phosphate decarboxylase n=1 Tax=Rickenella mellea TaxID=50990 RepID=A0A4V3AZK9_9AGAM|nr:Orotidine 5'-phosphate decarboxylase [Rickenella mellea]